VFSKTVDEAAWTGSSIARGDLADEIAALRRQPGGEIIAWGGANFAQSLSRAGLVDEYVLVIQPVAFGSGLPLFADLPDALRLELIEAKTFAARCSTSTSRAIGQPGPAHEHRPRSRCSPSRRDAERDCARPVALPTASAWREDPSLYESGRRPRCRFSMLASGGRLPTQAAGDSAISAAAAV
jgi:hypothetical protein